jgi:phage gp36-like protein
MSTYCTQANILAEIQMPDLINLTDDSTPPTGAVDDSVLDAVIANASGVIDQYVSNIYAVPLSPLTSGIISLATVITCYKLYRRRLVPDEKNNFTEDYKRAIKFLESVNSGDKQLDLAIARDFSQVAANTGTTPWGYGNSVASSR